MYMGSVRRCERPIPATVGLADETWSDTAPSAEAFRVEIEQLRAALAVSRENEARLIKLVEEAAVLLQDARDQIASTEDERARRARNTFLGLR
jgi:hypothetical protein